MIIKILNTQNKERILKTARKMCQVTYKCKPVRVTAAFSTEILELSRACNVVFQD
jgi:hypothetical protein